MKKRILSILLLFCIFANLAACSDDGSGKRVIFPIDAEPAYLDPQIASSPAECNLVANCFEGLVAYDENGAIVPAAAQQYDVSSDGLTYTFSLREDLQWLLTNAAKKFLGEEAANAFDTRLTAEDFVYGLQRALLPETNSPAAPQLLCIANAPAVHDGSRPVSALGVTAVDEHTVEIRLSRPDSDFLSVLTEAACMPCDAAFFAATAGRYGLSNEYLIYNGPFYISNWNSETAITVRKNETYHDAAHVMPASVYFSINNEQSTRAEKVEKGTYEIAPVTPAQAAWIDGQKHLHTRAFENATFCLLLNCGDALLQSGALRKAITLTFDPAALLEAKQTVAASGVLPDAIRCGGSAYRTRVGALQALSADKTRAKQLFSDALDDLDVREVDLAVLCTQEDETAVRTAMQQWQAAFGVKFSSSVEVVTSDELQQRLAAKDYQLAFAPLSFTEAPALRALRRFASDSADDPVALHSETFDRLLEQAANSTTEKGLFTSLRAAEKSLLDFSAVIPICGEKTYLAYAKGVSGEIASETGTVVRFDHVIVK